MTRKSDRSGPQAAGGTPKDTTSPAGRDPANKKLRVSGTDVATGKKATIIVSGRDPANGSLVTGIDEATGAQVTIKVLGRDPAN